MFVPIVVLVIVIVVLGVVLGGVRRHHPSVVLSPEEQAVVGKIGYVCSTPNLISEVKGQWFRRRRFSGSDLATTGESHSRVVNSYGCTAGGTLIWGGEGRRFHVVYGDGTLETVPYHIYEEMSPAQLEGVMLGTFLDNLSQDRKATITHIVLEEWDEDETSAHNTEAEVELTFLTDFLETLEKLPGWKVPDVSATA